MAIIYERGAKEDLDLGVGTITRTNPAGGQMTGHRINLSTFALVTVTSTDPGLVTPGTPVGFDIAVPGAQIGDHAEASFTGLWDDSLLMTARVVLADTVRIVIYNLGAAPFNPGSGTLRTMCFRLP